MNEAELVAAVGRLAGAVKGTAGRG